MTASGTAALFGLSFGGAFPVGLLLAGLALFAAVGALSHEQERPFSASIVYLALGVLAALVAWAAGVSILDPFGDERVIEDLAAVALVMALFATGLRIDPLAPAAQLAQRLAAAGRRDAADRGPGGRLRPRRAGAVGRRRDRPRRHPDADRPGARRRRGRGAAERRGRARTAASRWPARRGRSAHGRWGTSCTGCRSRWRSGAALGWALAATVQWGRERGLMAHRCDGWVAVAAAPLVYGAVEAAGAFGFLGVFVAGVAARARERDAEVHSRVHTGAHTAETLGELVLVLIVGSMLTVDGLSTPGAAGWGLIVLLLVVLRPAGVLIALVGSEMMLRQRLFVAWFGVRGIATLYYAVATISAGVLAPAGERLLLWIALGAVLTSLLAHGVSRPSRWRGACCRATRWPRRRPRRRPPEPRSGAGGRRRRAGLEPRDQLVEAQLLQAAADRVELAGAELDERAALLDELEGLAQPGLAGVQPADDLLEPRGGRLVGSIRSAHSSILARTASSAKSRRTRCAARAAAAEVMTPPSPSSTTA